MLNIDVWAVLTVTFGVLLATGIKVLAAAAVGRLLEVFK